MTRKMLTKEQRETLIQQHCKESDGRVRDRIKAVIMRSDGYSYAEIAKV